MGTLKTGASLGLKGKVGDRVYYTSNGKTVVRQISASEYNSKTIQQILQRVITKTCAVNYSALKDIVNHSFQGIKKGADSMAQFNSLNAHYFRERAAAIVNEGMSLDSFVNFAKLGQSKFVPAAVYVSTGTLVQMHPSITPYAGQGSAIAALACPENTYAALANQYNLKRGDQVTFLTVEKDQFGEYLVKYERIILDPRSGSDVAPMSSPLIVDNAFGTPSRRNEGDFFYLAYDDTAKEIRWKGIDGDVAAVAVIVSRKVGSEWFRNNAKFVLNEAVIGADSVSLAAAIAAAQSGTTEVYLDESDPLYLNNAGVGGAEGSANPSESDSPESSTPTIASVKIDGVTQNVAGGSVAITTANSSVMINVNGQNLTTDMFDAEVVGQAGASVIKGQGAAGINLSINGITKPATVNVKKDDALWFTLTVNAPSDGGSGDTDD